MNAAQPMMHSAGPNPGVATTAVDLWNWICAYGECFNRDKVKTFDQLLPSLRELRTWTDEAMRDCVRTKIGIRLPLGFQADDFLTELWQWVGERLETPAPSPRLLKEQTALRRRTALAMTRWKWCSASMDTNRHGEAAATAHSCAAFLRLSANIVMTGLDLSARAAPAI